MCIFSNDLINTDLKLLFRCNADKAAAVLNRVIDTFGMDDFNNGLDTFFVFKCYIGIIVGAEFELVVGFESHARCGNIYDIDINGSWLIRTVLYHTIKSRKNAEIKRILFG